MLGLEPDLPAAGGLAAFLAVRGRVRLVIPAHLLLVRLTPGFVAPIDALLVRLVIGRVGRLASGAALVLDQVQAFGMRFAGLGDQTPVDVIG